MKGVGRRLHGMLEEASGRADGGWKEAGKGAEMKVRKADEGRKKMGKGEGCLEEGRRGLTKGGRRRFEGGRVLSRR